MTEDPRRALLERFALETDKAVLATLTRELIRLSSPKLSGLEVIAKRHLSPEKVYDLRRIVLENL
ncbi:MAG: hypothetical protein PHO91_03695 [Patescibacteria group bacterium]|nr:hypothetical protein [Patescibacteria group bacterium]